MSSGGAEIRPHFGRCRAYGQFMGMIEYNSARPAIEVDDVVLAHLKIVIATKLRRQECFMMTWPSGRKRGGRLSAWIHASIPLVMEFDGDRSLRIDPRRVERMMEQVNARGELILDDLRS